MFEIWKESLRTSRSSLKLPKVICTAANFIRILTQLNIVHPFSTNVCLPKFRSIRSFVVSPNQQKLIWDLLSDSKLLPKFDNIYRTFMGHAFLNQKKNFWASTALLLAFSIPDSPDESIVKSVMDFLISYLNHPKVSEYSLNLRIIFRIKFSSIASHSSDSANLLLITLQKESYNFLLPCVIRNHKNLQKSGPSLPSNHVIT